MNPFLELNINGIKKIIICLNELCLDQKLITGYNGYFELPKEDTILLCLSNIYEGKNYEKDMIDGLKTINYNLENINDYIREKIGFYEWMNGWILIDDETKKVKNVNIKKVGSKNYIDLEEFVNKFGNYLHNSTDYNKKDRYVADDKNLEINLPVNDEISLKKLVKLFVENYSINKFNCLGEEIGDIECHWKGAWEIPVLLIGGDVSKYENDFPCFRKVAKILKKENGNEISFIIHEKFEKLRNSSYFYDLIDLGFKYEYCLANNPFILEYIDK